MWPLSLSLAASAASAGTPTASTPRDRVAAAASEAALAVFPPHRASAMGFVEVWLAAGPGGCDGAVTASSHNSTLTTTDSKDSGGGDSTTGGNPGRAVGGCVVSVTVANVTHSSAAAVATVQPPAAPWQRVRALKVALSGWNGAVSVSATVTAATGSSPGSGGRDNSSSTTTDGVSPPESFSRSAPAATSAFPSPRLAPRRNGEALAPVKSLLAPGSSDKSAATVVAAATWPYEVIDTGTRSTRLLDGAFVDIVHWSASEGAPFNEGLLWMTAADWRGQIADMASAGIRTATIQSIFINNLYPGDNVTCDNYPGVALYPSKAYPKSESNPAVAGGGRIDAAAATNFTDGADKLEAILSAADDYNVSVFVGLGAFAWFTYDAEALCWTKRVAAEVWGSYGHHRSLYGWYASGEMGGDFSSGGPNVTSTVDDMSTFFEEFSRFASNDLAPVTAAARPAGASAGGNNGSSGGDSDGAPPATTTTVRVASLMPVMQAINSYDVVAHATEPAGGWTRVLEHVDVLAAFGFARIGGTSTPEEVAAMCDAANTSFWVDMELFRADMTRGLLPKDWPGVEAEILTYDAAPQIGCAYEYTGQMAGPSPAPQGLNSTEGKALYAAYAGYYRSVLSGAHPWPPPPPPLPCVNASSNGTVQYVLTTADPGLCAPAPGSNVSHTHYVGVACGGGGGDGDNGDGGDGSDSSDGSDSHLGSSTNGHGVRDVARANRSIMWVSAFTPDHRAGLQPADCAWSRAANPVDVGTYLSPSCGVAPTRVRLPTVVCDPTAGAAALSGGDDTAGGRR